MQDWKAAADGFEVMIYVFYEARGFKTVYDWVSTVFRPLIAVAKKAYDAELHIWIISR